eukprot:361556-Chlamydomonas_euryale.AAC.8
MRNVPSCHNGARPESLHSPWLPPCRSLCLRASQSLHEFVSARRTEAAMHRDLHWRSLPCPLVPALCHQRTRLSGTIAGQAVQAASLHAPVSAPLGATSLLGVSSSCRWGSSKPWLRARQAAVAAHSALFPVDRQSVFQRLISIDASVQERRRRQQANSP